MATKTAPTRPRRTKAAPAKRSERRTDDYILKLYVTGSTSASLRAIQNIKRICDEHLDGAYDLEVIDIYQRPELAKGEQIIAAPTLIKLLPGPLKRLIGDMSNEERVLVGLDLQHHPRSLKRP